MPRTLVERAEFLEKRIREKGPAYFKVRLSPDLRLELDAMRGEKSLTDYVVETVAAHSAYLYDSAAQSQLHLFDFSDHFERAYAYEQRLKAPGKVPLKVKIDPDLRIDLEIQRDDMAVAEFVRIAVAKHCAYYGDQAIQKQISFVDYLNMAAERDRQDEIIQENEGGEPIG